MKKQFNLKKIIILCFIALVFISAMTVANISGGRNNGSFEEIWLKLWKRDGKVVDLRFQINRIGSSHRFEVATLPLSTYPFQFDLSDMGDVSADDIRGIVYGFRVTQDGRTDCPLMVRWWIVSQNQTDPKEPMRPLYPLTLKLRVWDSSGVEFNPEQQQAKLFERNGVLAESGSIL
jgi:hypothetical protein